MNENRYAVRSWKAPSSLLYLINSELPTYAFTLQPSSTDPSLHHIQALKNTYNIQENK